MCGLAGYFGWRGGADTRQATEILRAMTSAIRHRGPDADGHWISDDGSCGLGHRRLSIIDLSEAGSQPMRSSDGRYVIAFNGEIYNFQDLRREVEARRCAVRWRGHSDTEVLLELISETGLAEALTQVDGMFALALFDNQTRSLTLARDAFGEKPLYYGLLGGTLIFGSELKALNSFPGFSPTIDPQALADFFKYSYIPAPTTVYKYVFKLPPAHMLTVRTGDAVVNTASEPWWDMTDAALKARSDPFRGGFEEAIEAVREVLLASASRRLVSDVPLGALLSGGIDSSLTTALMQAASGERVKTFSIGMDERGYNEAGHARAVARHLGTEHHELVLTPSEVQAVIPEIAGIYDEPFADSSQVPTYLVSRMAREKVTVALSGDGGDELFAGYNRYVHAPAIWKKISHLPLPARRAVAALAGALPPSAINSLVALAGPFAPRELAAGRAGEKLQKLARVMAAADTAGFHDELLATAGDVRHALSISGEPSNLARRFREIRGLDFTEFAMLTDTGNYLPDDILAKVDRASMAVSLEIRTPFLSRELFSLAWSMPMEFKVSEGQGKRILRDLLYTMVPREIVDRPKAGFAAPVGRWLRSDLRDWAESLLSPKMLSDAGDFEVDEVRRRWSEHLSGRRDHETFLWSVLMYQGWRHAGHARATA